MGETEVLRCRRPSLVLTQSPSLRLWANDDDLDRASSRTAGVVAGIATALLGSESLAIPIIIAHAKRMRDVIARREMGYDEALVTMLVEVENELAASGRVQWAD